MSNFLPSAPQLAILVAMGVMIAVLWRRSNKHFGRGGKAYEAPHKLAPTSDDRDKALIDAPPEVTRWQVEMHELARDLKGEIDTKLALLQLLIRQANQAADRLERAARSAAGDRHVGDALDAIDHWQPDAATTTVPATLPNAQKVYALSDRGLSPGAIAAETGLSLGDVEMTLSLRDS